MNLFLIKAQMQSYRQCIHICPLFNDSQPTSPPRCTERLLKSLQLLKKKSKQIFKMHKQNTATKGVSAEEVTADQALPKAVQD